MQFSKLTKVIALSGLMCVQLAYTKEITEKEAGVTPVTVAAPAAKLPRVRIALMNTQAAILQTNEGKAAKAKMEEEIEGKRKGLIDQENELKKLDEEWQAQLPLLSEKDKIAKHKVLEEKHMNLQRAHVAYQQEIKQKEMVATQKIIKNLESIVDGIAKKKDYDLILDPTQGSVLWAKAADDITNEVIDQYNAKYKVTEKKTTDKKGKK